MDHPIVIDSAGGEYMETVLVLEWTRVPGEPIEAGQTIAVIETAKAATEIEATHSGYLKEILIKAGEEAPVGALLGRITDTPHAAPAEAPSADAPETSALEARPDAQGNPAKTPASKSRIIATPLARRIARERNIDLSSLTGTGPDGRIKRRDIDAVSARGTFPQMQAVPAPESPLLAITASTRKGVPIVFLHGFGADRSAWRQVTALLPPHHRAVLLDLPGHGDAPAIQVNGIDDLAFAVSDRLRAMGIDEAHLVGHSLGGATALALAETGPLVVLSLCLIAPGGLGPEVDTSFLRGFVAATEPESLTPWLNRMVADAARLPSGLARAILRQREKAGLRAAQEQIVDALFPNDTQGIRLRAALEGLTIPAKLIWGLDDAIIPSSHAFAAPGPVALHLLRNIGHVPQMESPALVARLIDELVRCQA